MHSLPIKLFLSCLAGTVAMLLTLLLIDFYRWFYLPPGPLPLPFIGNKFSLPKSKPWLQFDKWAKKYGPIYTIWIGRTPTLIVTSPTISHDLLVNRSAIFSSRPRSVVFGELYGRNGHIFLLPYGKGWSLRRRFFHEALKPSSLELYKPREKAEASILCSDILLDGGKNWSKIVNRYTAGIMFTTGYGRRIESMDAEVLTKKIDFIRYGSFIGTPGLFWAETLPWLKHMPNFLAPWKRVVEEKGESEAVFNISLVDLVRSDLAASTKQSEKKAIASFTESILSQQQKASHTLSLTPRHLAQLPSSFFTAGFDTTASTMGSCLLALITYPHVLRTVQTELDALLPTLTFQPAPRSPNFTDRPHLPYLHALILETLRWRPAAPLGLSHASTRSSTFEGWTVPAATTIIAASWPMNHNPDFYPLPELFEPARFLPASHPLYNPELRGEACLSQSGSAGFGWGRRACPGEQLAMDTLYIGIAKLIWGFEVKGVGSVDTEDYLGGFLIRPREFEVVFRVRSEEHRLVLERESLKARDILDHFQVFY